MTMNMTMKDIPNGYALRLVKWKDEVSERLTDLGF